MKKWTKKNRRVEARLRLIVDLGCRRDRILESPELEIEGLADLVEDYEAADLACAATDLRRRLEWYRAETKKEKK